MRTKLFLLLFMAFIPIAMLGATSYTADGVKYNLYTDGHAEVVADNYEGNVTIPNEVTYQGRKYKVTKIAASAFEGATKLTLVDLPKTLTTIGDYAFRGCTQLKAASLAEGISIGTEAFANTGIVKLQLEGSCNIGAKAFYNCKLQKVIVYGFPSSPSTIGSKAFGCDAGSDCVSSLKDFYFFSRDRL